MKGLVTTLFYLWASIAFSFPSPPTDSSHPGYPTRSSSFKRIDINTIRKGSFLFLPTEGQAPKSLLVFGHGQALSLKHYETLFERFTSIGIAVLYPKYDKGFFDTNWRRMGKDYDEIVQDVLSRYKEINKNNVIYSGHSKGGYIGLMAIGHRGNSGSSWWPKASIFYSPAGFDSEYLRLIKPEHDVHLVWPKNDSIIKEEVIDDIFNQLPSINKQKIVIQGYSDFEAGHFFPLTKSSLFGGGDGIGPLHYYGILPWTVGAIERSNYLYGDEASHSGDESTPHSISRSW